MNNLIIVNEYEAEDDENELKVEMGAIDRGNLGFFGNLNCDQRWNRDQSDDIKFKCSIKSNIESFDQDPKRSEKYLEELIEKIPYIRYKNSIGFLSGIYADNPAKKQKFIREFGNNNSMKNVGLTQEDILRYQRLIEKYKK